MSVTSRRSFVVTLPAVLAAGACATSGPPTPSPSTPDPSTATRPAAPAAPAWTDQVAYSIVRVEVRDGKAFGEYVVGHSPTIAAAGGRFIAAGAMPQTIEGTWPARRMVIHQWPAARAFLDWYDSAAYAPWKRLRQSASTADVVLVQGVAPSAPSAEVAPAFVVIDVQVRDGAAFGRYVQGHMPGLRAGGGGFLVAGGRIQVIEGGWTPRRLVMHRWPSAGDFRRWYESTEYRPWRDLRWSAAAADVALVEGLSERTKAERRMP